MKIWHFLLLFCLHTSCIKAADPKFKLQTLPFDSIMNKHSDYIIVLGDLQEYTGNSNNLPYYQQTINWVISQLDHGVKVSCILQTGDITSQNKLEEWERFRNTIQVIPKHIPIIACIGNHDYDWVNNLIPDRYSSLFSNGYITYDNHRIASCFEEDRTENIIVKCRIGTRIYYFINLEYGPRNEVIEWACNYIKQNRQKQFIILTHEYLTGSGKRINRGSGATEQLRNTTFNTPEQLWQNLIKDNDNIRWVLCGHNGFTAHLQSENNTNRAVSQILFNVQYQPHGGDGWIQIWEFPKSKDSIFVRTYNTIRHEERMDSTGRFSFKYK